MDAYNAILRAADHIDTHPKLFDFGRTRIPGNCRTPGCALGWIGFFAGRTKARMRGMFGFPFIHRGIAIVTPEGGCEPVITVTASEFYTRMDGLAVHSWREDAGACADAMRRYAERYHRQSERQPYRQPDLDPAYWAFQESLNELESSMVITRNGSGRIEPA